MTSMPCGPPKPRNAVCDVLLVFATRPSSRTFGIQYALSMWQSARASTGSERSRLQPPSAYRCASSACSIPSSSKPTFHLRVEAVPLAGHRHVLRAVEPQPHRAPGERRTQRRDGGEPVRLHLLAAERAAHAQALHGDLVAVQPEHVRDDLLRLGRVLGAALHEDLAALVDLRERAVRLQVEVLLAGELELALEHVGRRREAGVDVAAGEVLVRTLEARGRDRLARGDQRRQGLVGRPPPRRRRAGRPRASRRAPSRPRGRGT